MIATGTLDLSAKSLRIKWKTDKELKNLKAALIGVCEIKVHRYTG